ncbi:hypothetical protein WOLCODRAFT_27324 [Wolfiporia cocos MD-104 SS10]|uniref:FHA domain-containing protein n=1 Tax=Wolfiporia cocos (strain MD-104) TaxID=742152 RepID=A0A2H3IXB4_WOLCO|nr:hypothetical protein WOLCODRAFT_27324 [Wolfiporia cocos MD-104 SS10]
MELSYLGPCPAAGSISGISLHVEGRERDHGFDSQARTFLKTETRVITIGRRPKRPLQEDPLEICHALYNCPVVSRQHARITFTDYGNAYIVDLNSHHGTYILRPGDTVSKMIATDMPTVLADGDVITFGKSVGGNADQVRPVTVRVKLLFSGDLVAPRVANPLTPDTSSNSSISSNTGQYSIYVSSDSSSSSSQDDDSDIEEISPPSSPKAQPPSIPAHLQPFPSTRLGLLRRLLPAIHSSSVQDLHPTTSYSDGQAEAVHNMFESPQIQQNDDGLDHSVILPDSSSFAASTTDDSAVDVGGVGALPPPFRRRGSPHPISFFPLDIPFFPSDSFVSSGASASGEFPMGGHATSDCSAVSFRTPVSQPSGAEVVVLDDADGVASMASAQGESAITPPAQPSPASSDGSEDSSFEIQELEDRMNVACDDIMLLRMHRREDEVRFNQHVQKTKERLAQLEQRMQELEDSAVAAVSSEDIEMPDVMSRIDNMQAIIDNLQTDVAAACADKSTQDTAASIETIKAMLEDLKSSKEDDERQIARELEAMRAIRAQAEAAFAQLSTRQDTSSRKRKRMDDDEEDEGDATMQCAQITPLSSLESSAKRRRTMRIVSAVAQTATIATVGAVAAWTALAFA